MQNKTVYSRKNCGNYSLNESLDAYLKKPLNNDIAAWCQQFFILSYFPIQRDFNAVEQQCFFFTKLDQFFHQKSAFLESLDQYPNWSGIFEKLMKNSMKMYNLDTVVHKCLFNRSLKNVFFLLIFTM